MFSSPCPFQDKGVSKPIAQNIFGFFNLKELSKLAEVCKAWNGFIKDDILKVDGALIAIATSYKKYFQLYYSNSGFLLDVNTSAFFTDRKNYEDVLNKKIADELPFVKPCYDASLSRFNMYFWSSDGLNFHLMQEKPGGSSSESEKIVHFSTSEDAVEIEKICRIKYSPAKAILQEPKILEKKFDTGMTEEIIEFTFEDLENYVPPPPPKELISFARCPQRFEELFLQFILSGKINMLPYVNQIKLSYLFCFNESNLLFIGEQGNKNVLKIRNGFIWNDIYPSRILKMSDGSGSMHIPFNDNSDFNLIKIMNPQLEGCQAFIQMKDGKKINLIKMDLNEFNLAKLDFMGIDVENLRQTPLDIIQKQETKILCID